MMNSDPVENFSQEMASEEYKSSSQPEDLASNGNDGTISNTSLVQTEEIIPTKFNHPKRSHASDNDQEVSDSLGESSAKRTKLDGNAVPAEYLEKDDGPPNVEPSTEGTAYFSDNDVLSGRGGGTNVHPGNRTFRDLINMHRRAYLKARKNDKPAISRAIVRSIREVNGRFLRKDEKTGLWFEIGDDAAREKTSQALRQRAPEMRRLLFERERDEARIADDQVRQQRMFMGIPNAETMQGMGNGSAMYNPAFLAQIAANKAGANGAEGQNYSQMFSAALLGGMSGSLNRFAPNGA